MRASLALALVSLAVLAPGCDAVFGHLTIPTRPTTFNAISDDSGANPGGDIHWFNIENTTFKVKVTCLRVVGNRATIGTDWPFSSPPAGRFWYVEDNPGENADRLQEAGADSPPTTCPDPPTTITDNESAGGDIHVIDNFHPPGD
jgi:hypothetical protein